jgi:DNA-binding MarR family transcriptional regulator
MPSAGPDPDAVTSVSSQARELTAVVTRLRRALRTSIRTDYPWESLPMAQVELLMAVHEHQPARVGELAAALRLAPNTVSELVQALVAAGFAARRPDSSDRRVAVVTLTDRGAAELVDWERAHQRRIGACLERLCADDQALVRAALPALARLVDHLSATESERGRSSGR